MLEVTDIVFVEVYGRAIIRIICQKIRTDTVVVTVGDTIVWIEENESEAHTCGDHECIFQSCYLPVLSQ